ncbi:hypothetical protein D3C73_1609740 [compost metagenome]
MDLPTLAQAAPGQTLRFQQIGMEDAQRLDSERERAFAQLHEALAPLRAVLASA